MTVEEIAKMYDVDSGTCNNNDNNSNNNHRYSTGKTASSPSSTDNNSLWFLDVFEAER
jgi:hypothetical protein